MSNSSDLQGRTILQLIPRLNMGGAERTILEVAEALTEAGARALVASEGGTLERDLTAVGGTLITAPLDRKAPWHLRRNAHWLKTLVQRERIDLVHARSRGPAWSALWTCQALNVPLVTTYHGIYSSRSWGKTFYNSIMARGDRVIANSAWTADHVSSVHGIHPPQLVTIPRGIDTRVFDPDKVSRARVETLRTAWAIPSTDERINILLPGRLTAWKGQTLAITALQRLPMPLRQRARLILAGGEKGKGTYGKRLDRMISAAGLDGALVQRVGHVCDIPAALCLADIVIAPSTRPEAFGRTIPEGSAMARPVIAADHGGARETVRHGETGFLVFPGNIAALADAFGTLLAMTDTDRRAMGEAGRYHVAQRFSVSSLQRATLQVYIDVLRGKDAARPWAVREKVR